MRRSVGTPKLTATILTWALVIGGLGCQNEPPQSQAPPMPHVNVTTVVPQTIPDETEFIGQTASFRPVDIRSLVTGIILHLVSIVQLYKALGGGWPPQPTS